MCIKKIYCRGLRIAPGYLRRNQTFLVVGRSYLLVPVCIRIIYTVHITYILRKSHSIWEFFFYCTCEHYKAKLEDMQIQNACTVSSFLNLGVFLVFLPAMGSNPA